MERKSDGLFLGELMRKIFYELGYRFVNGGVIGEFFPYIEKGKGILFGFYGQ